ALAVHRPAATDAGLEWSAGRDGATSAWASSQRPDCGHRVVARRRQRHPIRRHQRVFRSAVGHLRPGDLPPRPPASRGAGRRACLGFQRTASRRDLRAGHRLGGAGRLPPPAAARADGRPAAGSANRGRVVRQRRPGCDRVRGAGPGPAGRLAPGGAVARGPGGPRPQPVDGQRTADDRGQHLVVAPGHRRLPHACHEPDRAARGRDRPARAQRNRVGEPARDCDGLWRLAGVAGVRYDRSPAGPRRLADPRSAAAAPGSRRHRLADRLAVTPTASPAGDPRLEPIPGVGGVPRGGGVRDGPAVIVYFPFVLFAAGLLIAYGSAGVRRQVATIAMLAASGWSLVLLVDPSTVAWAIGPIAATLLLPRAGERVRSNFEGLTRRAVTLTVAVLVALFLATRLPVGENPILLSVVPWLMGALGAAWLTSPTDEPERLQGQALLVAAAAVLILVAVPAGPLTAGVAGAMALVPIAGERGRIPGRFRPAFSGVLMLAAAAAA